MSQHQNIKQYTIQDMKAAKGQRKLSMITAYDFTFATLMDEAGVDMILVGDSLGMVMLGHDDTLNVTVQDMARHTAAVVRATRKALVIADLPFISYATVERALESAQIMVQSGGVRALKLEGGTECVPQIKAITGTGIPVLGHLGLTPQHFAMFGGYKVQAKTLESIEKIVEDALALQEAGCFGIVLECVPTPVAQLVTEKISIPTIGIGAGAVCDGQVLVLQDMLGMQDRIHPRFVKQYCNLGALVKTAVQEYCKDVQAGTFPASEHEFSLSQELQDAIKKL